MNTGEWKAHTKRIVKEKIGTNNIPIMLAALKQQPTEKLSIDPKLMATDRAIHHATAGRAAGRRKKKGGFNPQRDLTDQEIAQLPKRVADPDLILIEKQEREGKKIEDSEDWIFVYTLNKKQEARVVFRKNGEHPLQLVTFTKVKKGSTKERGIGKVVYKK